MSKVLISLNSLEKVTGGIKLFDFTNGVGGKRLYCEAFECELIIPMNVYNRISEYQDDESLADNYFRLNFRNAVEYNSYEDYQCSAGRCITIRVH